MYLRNALESMEATLDYLQQQGRFQTTGHIGAHWEHLSKSLKDGQAMLVELTMFIETVNREVAGLGGNRDTCASITQLRAWRSISNTFSLNAMPFVTRCRPSYGDQFCFLMLGQFADAYQVGYPPHPQ